MRPVVHDKRHALPQLGGDGHVWGLCGRILVMCSKVRTQGLGNLSKRRSTGVPWTWSGFLAVDPKFIPVRPRCGVDSSQVDQNSESVFSSHRTRFRKVSLTPRVPGDCRGGVAAV